MEAAPRLWSVAVRTIMTTPMEEYDAAANVPTTEAVPRFLVVEGCTDADYTEYDASANTDDGSCATLVVEGCTDANYTEYDASANTDDGSCATLVVEGCTDGTTPSTTLRPTPTTEAVPPCSAARTRTWPAWMDTTMA